MAATVEMRIVLAIPLCAAILLPACRAPKPGPKLIEADGVTYTACEGALWLANENNPKDPGTWSWSVVFKDAQGVTHNLPRVRMLTVTDLPNDTPACKTSH